MKLIFILCLLGFLVVVIAFLFFVAWFCWKDLTVR